MTNSAELRRERPQDQSIEAYERCRSRPAPRLVTGGTKDGIPGGSCNGVQGKPAKERAIATALARVVCGFGAAFFLAYRPYSPVVKSCQLNWLPGMDSNHDSRLQRPLSYH